MEERDSSSKSQQTRSQPPAPALARRRQQALNLLDAQRQQVDQIENELAAYLSDVERQIAAEANNPDQLAADQQRQANLDNLAEQLREQAENLGRQQAELSADRAEIVASQAEMDLAREQFARERQQFAEQQRQAGDDLDRRALELQALETKVKQSQHNLAEAQEAQQEDLRKKQQQLAEEVRLEREAVELRAKELQSSESKLKQARHALEAAQEEHQSEVRQFAGRRERIDAQQLRLEKQLEELEARGEETRAQRRRIAQQIRVERAALVQERELIQSEIDRQRKIFQSEAGRGKTELNKDRENFEQEMNRTRQQLRRDRQQLEEDIAAQDLARQQWEETRRAADKNRADQSTELAAAQHEIHKLVTLLTESQQSTADATKNLSHLQQENDSLKLELTKQTGGEEAGRVASNLQHERDLLTARIQLLEDQLGNAEKQLADQPVGLDEQHADELHRRFEMAVDDVRQLKRRNAELEEELADYQAAAAAQQPKSAINETVATDWESTKKRLLAELDEDEANPSGARLTHDDRLSVEGAIRITDDVIVARDQEIAELKQLLAQQTEQMAAESSAPQVPTVDPQIFDQDEIIRKERERLATLEKEWQEKLRQAEVDISVQRAKIARERAGLEELQRQLASEKAALAGQRPGQSANPNAPKKPGQRWLARLGLKENDNE